MSENKPIFKQKKELISTESVEIGGMDIDDILPSVDINDGTIKYFGSAPVITYDKGQRKRVWGQLKTQTNGMLLDTTISNFLATDLYKKVKKVVVVSEGERNVYSLLTVLDYLASLNKQYEKKKIKVTLTVRTFEKVVEEDGLKKTIQYDRNTYGLSIEFLHFVLK